MRPLGETPGEIVLRAAASADIQWIEAPMAPSGRLELTRWTREQVITETRHRYGNLGMIG